jgi:hypothetical protein
MSLNALGGRIGCGRGDGEEIFCGGFGVGGSEESGAVFACEFNGGLIGEIPDMLIECELVVVGVGCFRGFRCLGSGELAVQLSECEEPEEVCGGVFFNESFCSEGLGGELEFFEGFFPAGLADEDFAGAEVCDCFEGVVGGRGGCDLSEFFKSGSGIAVGAEHVSGFDGIGGCGSGEEHDFESAFAVVESFEPDSLEVGAECGAEAAEVVGGLLELGVGIWGVGWAGVYSAIEFDFAEEFAALELCVEMECLEFGGVEGVGCFG